jgi:hypothetical protein
MRLCFAFFSIFLTLTSIYSTKHLAFKPNNNNNNNNNLFLTSSPVCLFKVPEVKSNHDCVRDTVFRESEGGTASDPRELFIRISLDKRALAVSVLLNNFKFSV